MGKTTICMGAALAFLLSGVGCSRHAEGRSYAALVSFRASLDVMMQLDAPQSELLSSYDRTGGNEDFNQFAGQEGTNWAVLADLKGPGVVTRFWTTGGASANQRLKFYFDGERTPRIDATVAELRSGQVPPFMPPLSRYEQSCWWTYVPLTYNKRLRILAETHNFTQQGWPRLFYQINASSLGHAIETFPKTFTAADQQALSKLADSWALVDATAPDAAGDPEPVVVAPGEIKRVVSCTGPGVIRQIRFALDCETGADLFLRMTWDDSPLPSIAVPLAAFVGKLWHATDHASATFGSSGNTWIGAWPMPFAEKAELSLENRGTVPVSVSTRLTVESRDAHDPTHGYLHAEWHRSTPQERGQPHRIASVAGQGKFVGCILGVASADNSWWVLESDETIRIDDETFPGSHGTGLEDYFNGAWYYRNNLTRALHGLSFKRPYVAVQYRLHTADARRFDKSLDVAFDRGPDQASRAWMASVGFYYLDKPQAVGSDAWTGEEHRAPQD
ncbi:MAG: DUF2961 domain-containing protein, partial [Verrucomicrobia bacterium]|nr:DUF2961 domain-containing protein [Verrucomicrobiota bacterium]